jgi:hypothetical protein
MVLLTVGGAGLPAEILGFLGSVIGVIFAGFGIVTLAAFALVGIVVWAFLRGIGRTSIGFILRFLIKAAALIAGISAALFFVAISTAFFSLSFIKMMLVAVLVVLVVSAILRLIFMSFIFRRFGKYIFYLTTLHLLGKTAYEHVKQETNPGPNNF